MIERRFCQKNKGIFEFKTLVFLHKKRGFLIRYFFIKILLITQNIVMDYSWRYSLYSILFYIFSFRNKHMSATNPIQKDEV